MDWASTADTPACLARLAAATSPGTAGRHPRIEGVAGRSPTAKSKVYRTQAWTLGCRVRPSRGTFSRGRRWRGSHLDHEVVWSAEHRQAIRESRSGIPWLRVVSRPNALKVAPRAQSRLRSAVRSQTTSGWSPYVPDRHGRSGASNVNIRLRDTWVCSSDLAPLGVVVLV